MRKEIERRRIEKMVRVIPYRYSRVHFYGFLPSYCINLYKTHREMSQQDSHALQEESSYFGHHRQPEPWESPWSLLGVCLSLRLPELRSDCGR